METQQVNIRLTTKDHELVKAAAHVRKTSVSSLVASAARVIAVDILIAELPELQGEVRRQVQQQLGRKGREYLRQRFSEDIERLQMFVREIENDNDVSSLDNRQ